MEFDRLAKRVMHMTAGAFTAMTWQKELSVRAAFKDTIKVTKVTKGVVRFGVDYENIKATKEKRESGILPAENTGLPWGTWNIFPYFIKHNEKNYVRCTVSHNNPMHSVYYINGRVASKTECEQYCTKSAFGNGEVPDILTINVENVIKVG